MSAEISSCTFCGGRGDVKRAAAIRSIYVECVVCLASGPKIDADRLDAQQQAIAAWNAGRKFGVVAVAAVPGGMPTLACSAAERIRLIAEGIYEGRFGNVDAAVVLLRTGRHVEMSTHNLSPADVARVLDAARDSTRARAAAVNLQPPR